jgi:hypothetical protein
VKGVGGVKIAGLIIPTLLYADNVALAARTTLHSLHKYLAALQTFCTEVGMDMAKTKVSEGEGNEPQFLPAGSIEYTLDSKRVTV